MRAALLARKEIALVDVREEDPYAQAHPLWAANLPLSRLELEAWSRIPRRDTLIVWDNRFSLHRGIHDFKFERRHLIRTTVRGERPLGTADWVPGSDLEHSSSAASA